MKSPILGLHQQQSILSDQIALKKALKEVRPDCIVSFMTIPPVIYTKQLKYWQDQGKLADPTYTLEYRENRQKTHNLIIEAVNKNINKLNHQEQGGIKCQTASWHSEVLKKLKNKTRLIPSSLYDGIHGTDRVKEKWHRSFHNSIQKEIRLLQASTSSGADATY